MISRKIQIVIVLGAIIVVGTILPSKIRDMILIGGSEANDIFLNLLGTVASLFTLLAIIDSRKKSDTTNSDITPNEVHQSKTNTNVKKEDISFYCRLNRKIEAALKNLPKHLVDHIIIIMSLFVVMTILFIAHFNDIACHFYGVTKEANGQLLTVLLTAIGGGAVIYGLYLNNKRLREQSRQNDIAKRQADAATDNNNDKRFGDAIGYLGSDNTSVVLGGIYTLYQLAKEDSRYIPLVNNLYSGYLKDKSSQFYTDDKYKTKPPVVIQAVIDIYFNDNSIFKDELIDLSNVTLSIIDFNSVVNNCLFKNAKLTCCNFNKGLNNCDFEFAKIKSSSFKNGVHKCSFRLTDIKKCNFKDIDAKYVLSDCLFSFMNMEEITFEGNCINNMTLHIDTAKSCVFDIERIENSLLTCFEEPDIDFRKCEFINTRYLCAGDTKENENIL